MEGKLDCLLTVDNSHGCAPQSTIASDCQFFDRSENNTKSTMIEIPRLNIYVDPDNFKSEVLKILNIIMPTWNVEDIEFQIFSEGITNKLIACHHIDDVTRRSSIVIRLYGANTDLIIDRRQEILNMQLMYAAGQGSQIYGIFDNGLAYQFLPGKCLTVDNVRDPLIGKMVAVAMLQMHKAGITSIPRKASLFDKCRQFINLIPDHVHDNKKFHRIKTELHDKKELLLELEFMEKELASLNSPIVFSHNDLLLNNILLHPDEDKVTFIDFEYGSYNYEAFDIANHFAEFAGVDEIDYSLFPGKEFQIKWLRTYLELKAEFNGKDHPSVLDVDVERLHVIVNKFVLMSHFFWGLWAIVQAHVSEIDFDYIGYALQRFKEYFCRKNEFLDLHVPSGNLGKCC